MPNVAVCIKYALAEADGENKGINETRPCRSILFPVFGTGVAGGRFRDTAKELMSAALNHVENHGSTLDTIYFLAYDKPELIACLDVLNGFARGGRLQAAEDETDEKES